MIGASSLPAVVWIAVIGSTAVIAFVGWAGIRRVAIDVEPLSARERGRLVTEVGAALMIWWTLAVLLSALGLFEARPDRALPAILFGILGPIAAGYAWYRSSSLLSAALDRLPPHWVIGLQVYRAFGAIFLALLSAGRLPAIFAIPAGIGDVLVGIAAPFVAYAVFWRVSGGRTVAIVWNLAGILDLVIAVGIGFLAGPGPYRALFTAPSTELLTVLPLAMIPTVAVPLSILLHLISLRALVKAEGRLRHLNPKKRWNHETQG